MIPTRNLDSRYASTARRTLLARQAAIAALVLLPGIACGGSNDAAVFESNQSQATAPDDTAAPTAAPTTNAPATKAPATTPATAATSSTDAEPTTTAPAAVFPATGELAVSFTFAPAASGGRIENPYIAVWVEDADGNLVKTISLWYKQSAKGTRYLSDLRAWSSSSGQTVDVATSGATRVAGDYTVVWDGTDLAGDAVAQGDYVLYIEAAREHGPYEITSTPITVGDEGFTVALADNGELTGATAELTV
jgi:hypothetical protein